MLIVQHYFNVYKTKAIFWFLCNRSSTFDGLTTIPHGWKHMPTTQMEGWQMVPWKTWVSENIGRILKSWKHFGKSPSLVLAWFAFTFFLSLEIFTKESQTRIFNYDLSILASLGFYHLPPLNRLFQFFSGHVEFYCFI